ncbi:MAG: alpha-L-fucosidase [Candidatus Hydrogenedens sp.]|jgi:alpha-L-fucosidase|nr:alpha-L-fucosidase [Candidatus Hydrogenedens sp.]
MKKTAVLLLLLSSLIWSTFAAGPPAPYGPVPSERQLRWHELEFYGFIHFTINTFTNKEWGYGDEPPRLFNPTDFDAQSIATLAREAGMKGLILTCKHHDGFCLWPSAYTEHSIAASPWKEGQGDMVREFADACRNAGILFGVYLSPWDRNHAEYGRPAYVQYYRNQLRELLTGYGDIFEVWFDGANGGDGWYGGARETRSITEAYYGWDDTFALVRELQPQAVIFSHLGDIRWVGNESGHAGDPCWATFTPQDKEDGKLLGKGMRDGTRWQPAEVDVSIRPGWFYHKRENSRIRTPGNLMNLYFQSVGRGASLLLNLPPDRRGRIHERDEQSLLTFGNRLKKLYAHNLADGATAAASNVRGGDERFGAAAVLDPSKDSYWCGDDDCLTPELILELPEVRTFDVVSIREYPPLGQRVDSWALDARQDGEWMEFASGTSIGSRRLWRGKAVTTDGVRLRITGAAACPAITELSLYRLAGL